MTTRVLLRRTLALPVLLAAVAGCSDDDSNGPGRGTFTLGAPASNAVSLPVGSATTVSIPVTFTGAFDPVTLRADSVPTGVRVGFQPSTITRAYETVIMSITANPDAAIGTGTMKVVAKATNMTDQVARVAITTTARPSYSLASAVTTTPVAIQRTTSGTFTVAINRAGFTGPLDFLAEGLPTGVTVPMVTNVTGNAATVTVNTAANASANTGTFTLRSTNPTIGDRTMTVRFTVVAEPGVQIAAPATQASITGNPDSLAVSVTREGGFNGPVTVALSNLPAGMTASSVTSASGSTVYVPLTIATEAVAGTSAATVTVSGDGIATKTTTASLRIQTRNLTHNVPVVRVGDTRARNSARNYRMMVPAGTTKLVVTFTGGTGDGDLYLYNPAGTFVAGSEAVDNNETVTIDNPVAGNWFLQLVVWNPYEGGTLLGVLTPVPAATEGTSSLMQAAAQSAPVTFRSTRRNTAELKVNLDR